MQVQNKLRSMCHFVIDAGNTCVKAAVLVDGMVTDMCRSNSVDADVIRLASSHDVSCGILSSVRELDPAELALIESLPFRMLRLSASLPLPIRIGYSTPDTLGPDRIAAAAGAWHRCPGCNILVIDAGTAITYDIVTSSGEYLGGNISPGKSLRFRALHEFTGHLPLVSASDSDQIPDVGFSTETAIRSGVIRGIQDEIHGCIARLSDIYNPLTVFFTGGDIKLLEIPIKSGIFADGFLVLKGLDSICSFNEKI